MAIIRNKFIIANDTTVIIELHQYEMELIKMLRSKYRFGDVTIKMQDGLPQYLVRVTEIDKLNKLDK